MLFSSIALAIIKLRSTSNKMFLKLKCLDKLETAFVKHSSEIFGPSATLLSLVQEKMRSEILSRRVSRNCWNGVVGSTLNDIILIRNYYWRQISDEQVSPWFKAALFDTFKEETFLWACCLCTRSTLDCKRSRHVLTVLEERGARWTFQQNLLFVSNFSIVL